VTRVAGRRRRWPWVVLVVVLAWLGVVGVLSLRVLSHIRNGEDAVRAAQAGIKASTITDPRSPDLLAPVVSDFGAAHGDLDNPLLAPVGALPVIGRQLRSVRALASAAERVGIVGEAAVHQARAALQAPHADGPQRLAAIRALASAATTADVELDRISLGPDRALLGPIRSRYEDFATRLAKVQAGLHRGAVAAQALSQLFAGPSHVLLMAANNAEMRDGSGMFLSLIELDIDDGHITLGPVQSTEHFQLAPGAVPLTGGYASPWGGYQADVDWRNLGVTPRFDETGAMAAQMWQVKTGQPIDAVMSLDIAGVQALLGATGPVQAGGKTVSASGVVPLLMHDQYLGVGVNAFNPANVARQEQLGRIADAAFAAIERGGYNAGSLASSLPLVVAGRHLMMWSKDPSMEADWTAAGVSGSLQADTLLAAVQNMGANKLDYFLTTSSDIVVEPGPLATIVTVTVHLSNATPLGQPAYVAGTGIAGEPPNTYRAYVTLTMPVSAFDISVDRTTEAQISGADGPVRTVAVLRDVGPGKSLTVTFTFSLPGAHGHLQVESSARVPAATISVPGGETVVTIPDDQRPRIEW